MSTPVSCLFYTSTPGHNFKKSEKLFEERKGASSKTVGKMRINFKPLTVEASESKPRNISPATTQSQMSAVSQ